MNTPELVQWQKIAPNGICYPWWTHPFLDELETWNLSNKNWLEFGSGLSSAWLRSKCKWVDSIEANIEWAIKSSDYCYNNLMLNGHIHSKNIPDGVQEVKDEYFDLINKSTDYDIISVDGIWRFESLQWALDHFKGRGGILIADNWRQSGVWISPPSEELMAPYEIHSFEQTDHTDNDGVNKWKTVYWNIPA